MSKMPKYFMYFPGARTSVEERFNADHMWTELAGVVVDRGLVRC